MSFTQKTLFKKYASALHKHLDIPDDESYLHDAYELGRKALHDGLGVLDVTALYHDALAKRAGADGIEQINRSVDFFAESLSPYEMMLRGYRESNARLTEMNKTLRETKAMLESLLAAYERAERVSARFQQAALPEALPDVLGFHLDAYYQPGPSDSLLGGDWYDAVRLADGRIVISIGDVGGSGLGAAIIMVTMRQVIRGVAYVHPDPVMILDAASKTLMDEHPNSYVSAFVGVIDPIEMTLAYASAGHPPPLLREPNGKVRELTYDGLLLGIWTPEGRSPQRLALVPNSLLVLYTDGLIEATDDISASETRLREIVAQRKIKTSKKTALTIRNAVLTDQARDDVAILTIKILRQPPRVGLSARTSQDISCWAFDATDGAAAQRARAAFASKLRTLKGATDDDVYDAEIVFGELVGNVLRHASGIVEIFVEWGGPAPVLHVRDQGSGFSHAPRLPHDPLAESGRGLYIVARLTDDFNVTRMTACGSHARAVISLSSKRLSHAAHRVNFPPFGDIPDLSDINVL